MGFLDLPSSYDVTSGILFRSTPVEPLQSLLLSVLLLSSSDSSCISTKLDLLDSLVFIKEKLIHIDPLPLPTTMDAVIAGGHYKLEYLGHGQSKVAYSMKKFRASVTEASKMNGKVFEVA